jgi:UDP:flavonoid glycosyltransferase YjiC (YdhE family)
MFALLTTNPYYGHFHPLTSVATPLKEAGHDVAFATTADFHDVVAAAGFSALAAGLPPFHTWGWDEAVTRRKVHDLLELSRVVGRPDLVIREITDFAGLIAAEVLGVPHVTLGAGVFIDTPWWRRILRGSLDRIRADYGVPGDPSCARLHQFMYCDLVPPWFQQFPAGPPRTHRYFRVDREPELTGPPPGWLAGLPGRPSVYVTFGTVYNKNPRLLRTILYALRDEPVNVICTVGADQDPATVFPAGLPANAFVERYVPQGHLLPRCDVIITHGGYNTLLGALRHDVLPLVIPFGSDQPLNARRCVDLGIGLRMAASEMAAAAVREATVSLLHAPWRRSRLRWLKRRDSGVPDVQETVAAFERLVERSRARRRGQRRRAQPDRGHRAAVGG